MCICVNCHWVDRCKAYHAVEKQHGVDHLTNKPDLEPKHPRIHVIVQVLPEGGSGVEWDVQACASFLEDSGRWQRLRPGHALPK